MLPSDHLSLVSATLSSMVSELPRANRVLFAPPPTRGRLKICETGLAQLLHGPCFWDSITGWRRIVVSHAYPFGLSLFNSFCRGVRVAGPAALLTFCLVAWFFAT